MSFKYPKEGLTLEQVTELYEALQGKLPKGVRMQDDHTSRLTEEQAFSVIWLLQEHYGIIPDVYERCAKCGIIYDSWQGGGHVKTDGNNYCYNCLGAEYQYCEDCGELYDTRKEGVPENVTPRIHYCGECLKEHPEIKV